MRSYKEVVERVVDKIFCDDCNAEVHERDVNVVRVALSVSLMEAGARSVKAFDLCDECLARTRLIDPAEVRKENE